jgi:cell division protein FtsW
VTTSRRPATKRPATKRPATKRPATKRPATKRPATKRPPTRRPEVEVVRRGPSPELVVMVAVGILCGLGLVMVYSASSVLSVQQHGSSWAIVARQFVWLMVGIAVAFGASRVSMRTWREKVAGPMLAVAVVLLAYVAAGVVLPKVGLPRLPYIVDVNGATRWLGIGAFQFQPSELAKPALILWLARLLSDRRRDLGTFQGLKPVLLSAGVVGMLVLVGDDLGTTMLLGVIVLTMLYMAGAPVRTVAGIGGALGAAAIGSLLFLESFRVTRIMAFLQPEKHLTGAGYQLLQSQIGLASGGLFGTGPGLSKAKWGFLPEAHTDFILAVIGEELGLVGSVVVIGLFVAFMGAGCMIGLRARTRFARLVAFGVTAWIGVQALINIGVTVGTLPTKGITLPFVSYGGSSLMMSMFGVGILLSVARER